MNRIVTIFYFVISFFLFSCEEEEVIVEGLAPVYLSAEDFTKVYSTDTMPFNNLGNIVISGNYIFINEKNQGIHVINNIDPNHPYKAYFWKIPGNREFLIKGNILYADNSVHLLVIDISDFGNIKVLSYMEDLYIDSPDYEPRPPDYFGMFECVDRNKGIHVGWEKKMLTNPLCEAY